jgi:GR25 family glycosyltransferase involved in LPS biosynthesis
MKTLNDYFSKIYCINLDRRPDRYEQCLNEFKKLNVVVERVSAVDGNKFLKTELNSNSAHYGLILTNVNILKDAILNNYDNVLILEDDVNFVDDFYEKFEANISFLPNDWDFLYLGGCILTSRRNVTVITKNCGHELCKIKRNVIVTHAVAINSKFYNILLEAISKEMTNHIDIIQSDLQDKYNIYVFMPNLVIQRTGFSDITNNFRVYNNN